MAVSPRLPKHLRAVLGLDAGEELVTILDEIRADRAQLIAAFTSKIDELSREMHLRFEQVDQRFEQVNQRFDQVNQRFDQVDRRFERADDRLLALEGTVADVKSDLMKWSFVFWCGAVAAVAALAGVLR